MRPSIVLMFSTLMNILIIISLITIILIVIFLFFTILIIIFSIYFYFSFFRISYLLSFVRLSQTEFSFYLSFFSDVLTFSLSLSFPSYFPLFLLFSYFLLFSVLPFYYFFPLLFFYHNPICILLCMLYHYLSFNFFLYHLFFYLYHCFISLFPYYFFYLFPALSSSDPQHHPIEQQTYNRQKEFTLKSTYRDFCYIFHHNQIKKRDK